MMMQPSMREDDLLRNVIDYCNLRGVRFWRDNYSRQNRAGWPDITIWGPGGLLFRELKSGRGELRPAQVDTLKSLCEAGQDAGVWRPVDWPVRVMREIDAVRRVCRG